MILDKVQALHIASSCQCQNSGARQGENLTFPQGGLRGAQSSYWEEEGGFAEGKGDDESTEGCRAQHEAIADCVLPYSIPGLNCSRQDYLSAEGKGYILLLARAWEKGKASIHFSPQKAFTPSES